jgi:hypothetical protein
LGVEMTDRSLGNAGIIIGKPVPGLIHAISIPLLAATRAIAFLPERGGPGFTRPLDNRIHLLGVVWLAGIEAVDSLERVETGVQGVISWPLPLRADRYFPGLIDYSGLAVTPRLPPEIAAFGIE